MRNILRCIATAATVIHLSFGCCLHPAHFDGRDACCGGTVAGCDDQACGHEPNAGHLESTHACEGRHERHTEVNPLASVSAPALSHGCNRCSCVVTEPDGGRQLIWPPVVCGRVEIVSGDALAGDAAALARRRPPESSSHGSERLRALFERFLI